MMVLPLTFMDGFQTGSGVLEVVVLRNEVRGFQEVGVDENMIVMIAMDEVAGPPELTVAGLRPLGHKEIVKRTG